MAATLGELKAALYNADKAGDMNAARQFAAAITHMQTSGLELYEPPAKPMGVVDSVIESATGDKRKTKTTESLPDWAGMPELNSLSLASAKTGVGTLLSSPKETADIIKANFPDAQIRKDEKGNYVIKSSIDGQEYAIKPGFQVSDIPRALGALVAFTPAGRAASIPGAAIKAAGTQAIIEGSQAATGGEFNPGEVAVAGALGGAVPAVVGAVKAVSQPVTAAVKRALGAAPESPAPVASAVPPVAPATPVTPPAAVAPMTGEQLGQTAKSAAEGSKGATKVLAEQAMPDPKTVEAAKRLGIEDYLQPDHVTTNQAYRELAQAVKSVPGSTTRSAEIEGLNAVGKRADDLIIEIGGTQDVSTLNANVKSRLQATQQDLDKTADKLYAQLRETIPAKTEAPATNVLEFIKQRADDLGGPENLTPLEKTILKKLSPKAGEKYTLQSKPTETIKMGVGELGEDGNGFVQAIAGQVDNPKFFSSFTVNSKGETVAAAQAQFQKDGTIFLRLAGSTERGTGKRAVDDVLAKMAPESNGTVRLEASKNQSEKFFSREGFQRIKDQGDGTVIMEKAIGKDFKAKAIAPSVKQPTYTLLDDVRRDLGSAGKMTGPFKDADVGLAKKLYSLLTADQEVVAGASGASELWQAAKSTVQLRKGVEDDLTALFGKTLDSSIVGDLSSAVKSLPSGDVSKLVRLLKLIPENMRQEVMATGLNTAFGKQIQNGSLNFNTYAKWYEGLTQNKQAYAAVMSNLPAGAQKQLSDLYRVSKGVSMATRERITTGRIQAVQQELLGTDSLIENLYNVAKRSAVGLAAEAVTTPLGAPGAGLAAGIASALTKGAKPNVMKAADALISSPEFTEAVKKMAAGDKQAAAVRLAYSKPFTRFVRAAGSPREMTNRERWILQMLETNNQAGERK